MLNNKKFLKLFSLLVIIVFMLSSCTNSKLNDSSLSKNPQYPLTFEDSFGCVTDIDSVPQKVVSLSPNITEIVCELGLIDNLVGRTDYCDYPEEVSNIDSIGGIIDPNIEKIVSLEPDIIFTDGMQSQETISFLRQSGLKVVMLRGSEDFEGTYKIISDLGMIMNQADKANTIIKNMKWKIEKIQQKVNSIKDKKSVFYLVSLDEDGVYTAGNETYINEILKIAGVENVAQDVDGWYYSIEKLCENNPQVIICSDQNNTKQSILDFEPISSLDAVKNQSIVEVDEDLISRQGPRNIEGIKQIVEKVYNINMG